MKDLILNPITLSQVNAFVDNPSHALLISGADGSGKTTMAGMIALQLLGLGTRQSLANYPYFTHLKRPEGKQDIPIASIRELGKLLKLKAPGARAIRRVILIEDARDLNDESATALLKMLEEPAPDCVFILTAASPQSLLPTIASRAQHLQIRPVSLPRSLKFLESGYKTADIESAWRLSQGGVGLMLSILRGSKDHPLKVAIDEAKSYLRSDSYQRVLMADTLGRDKKRLSLLLEALVRLLGVLQHSGVESRRDVQQKKLLSSRRLVLGLQRALGDNDSPRLVALELALNLL